MKSYRTRATLGYGGLAVKSAVACHEGSMRGQRITACGMLASFGRTIPEFM